MASTSGGRPGTISSEKRREKEAIFLSNMRRQGQSVGKYVRQLKDAGIVDSTHAVPFHREAIDAEIQRLVEQKQQSLAALKTVQEAIASLDEPQSPTESSSEDVAEFVDQVERGCKDEAVLRELVKRIPSLRLPSSLESHDRKVQEIHSSHQTLVAKAEALETVNLEHEEVLQRLSAEMPTRAEIEQWKDYKTQLTQAGVKLQMQDQEITRLKDVDVRLKLADDSIQTQAQELFTLGQVKLQLGSVQEEATTVQRRFSNAKLRCRSKQLAIEQLTSLVGDLRDEVSLHLSAGEQVRQTLVEEEKQSDKLMQKIDDVEASFEEMRLFNIQQGVILRQAGWDADAMEERLVLTNRRNELLSSELDRSRHQLDVEAGAFRETISSLQATVMTKTDQVNQLQSKIASLGDEIHLGMLASESTEVAFQERIDRTEADVRCFQSQCHQLETELDGMRRQRLMLNDEIQAEVMAAEDLQTQLVVNKTKLADCSSAMTSGRVHAHCRTRYSSLQLLYRDSEAEASRLGAVEFQRTYEMAALREEIRQLESKLKISDLAVESQSNKAELRHQTSIQYMRSVLGAVLSVDTAPSGNSVEPIAVIFEALLGTQMEDAATDAWIAEFSCLAHELEQVDDWHMLRCFFGAECVSFDDLRAVAASINRGAQTCRRWKVSILLAYLEARSEAAISPFSVAKAIVLLTLVDLLSRLLENSTLSERVVRAHDQLARNLMKSVEVSTLVGGLAEYVAKAISGSRSSFHQEVSICADRRNLKMLKDGMELISDEKRLIVLSGLDPGQSLKIVWQGELQLVVGPPMELRILNDRQEELRKFTWTFVEDSSGVQLASTLFKHALGHWSRRVVERGFKES